MKRLHTLVTFFTLCDHGDEGSQGYQLLSPRRQTLKASHLRLALRPDKTLPEGHLAKANTTNDWSLLAVMDEFTKNTKLG